ncbi:MAG: type IV pilus modification PilV family protein [Candidatus Xenobia bacterium]
MHAQRGFSLVEVMVAMFVFVVSFLGVVSVYPTAMHSVQGAKNLSLAQNIASQQMELALDTPYATLAQDITGGLTTDARSFTLLCSMHGAQQTLVYNYSRVLTFWDPVLQQSSTTDSGLIDIRVQVDWLEDGRLRLIDLESQLHD